MTTQFCKQRTAVRSVRAKRRLGSALVETAVVLPLCLLFIFGIMEYGRYLMMMHLAHNAAREGARYAVSHTDPVVIDGITYGNNINDVKDVVTKFLTNKRFANQTINVYMSDANGNNIGTWTNAGAGQLICVQLSGQFQWFTPRLLKMNSATNVQVRSVMRSESN
jgi:Flp pilus assembly protein TadG